MDKIILKFLTSKGEKAYHSVDAEGKKQRWRDKRIAEKVCSDKVLSKNPLVIEIKIKIGWLAVQVELPKQIQTGLERFDAVQGRDYTMDIQY